MPVRAETVGPWWLNGLESLCPLPMTSGAAVQKYDRAAIAGARAADALHSFRALPKTADLSVGPGLWERSLPDEGLQILEEFLPAAEGHNLCMPEP